jgi:hypothetical protein
MGMGCFASKPDSLSNVLSRILRRSPFAVRRSAAAALAQFIAVPVVIVVGHLSGCVGRDVERIQKAAFSSRVLANCGIRWSQPSREGVLNVRCGALVDEG